MFLYLNMHDVSLLRNITYNVQYNEQLNVEGTLLLTYIYKTEILLFLIRYSKLILFLQYLYFINFS